MMDKQVLAPVLGRDEAESLVVVEPFDGSFHAHCALSPLEDSGVCRSRPPMYMAATTMMQLSLQVPACMSETTRIERFLSIRDRLATDTSRLARTQITQISQNGKRNE
jgi:hypothetical protein